MSSKFFNTIHLKGVSLKKAWEKAKSQEERIYLLMLEQNIALTPFQVHYLYNQKYEDIPVTSIRRAMTNLCNTGFIAKTEKMQEGIYGMPNHKWIIKQYKGVKKG